MQLPYGNFKNSHPVVLASSLAAGQERWVLYSLFLDESGKTDKVSTQPFAGSAASMDEWGRFAHFWDEKRRRWDLPTIRMSRIMAPETAEKKGDKWDEYRTRMGDSWPNWRNHV